MLVMVIQHFAQQTRLETFSLIHQQSASFGRLLMTRSCPMRCLSPSLMVVWPMVFHLSAQHNLDYQNCGGIEPLSRIKQVSMVQPIWARCARANQFVLCMPLMQCVFVCLRVSANLLSLLNHCLSMGNVSAKQGL